MILKPRRIGDEVVTSQSWRNI